MPEARVLLGVIGRPHGVRGLLRVHAHTAEPDGLFAYGPLCDAAGRWFSLRPRGEGVCEVAEIVAGKRVPVTDRATAERLVNLRLYLPRERLPPPGEDEFYLADLVGLEAVDPAGRVLGPVAAVHDYGAGASLEIGALLVPFTRDAVPSIDLAAGRMIVVPPAEVAAPR
jgi:16S rRNA processing protein RimM